MCNLKRYIIFIIFWKLENTYLGKSSSQKSLEVLPSLLVFLDIEIWVVYTNQRAPGINTWTTYLAVSFEKPHGGGKNLESSLKKMLTKFLCVQNIFNMCQVLLARQLIAYFTLSS